MMPVRTLLPPDENVLATAKVVLDWKLTPQEVELNRTPFCVEPVPCAHGSTAELVSILNRNAELRLHKLAAWMKAASKSGEPDTVGLPGELAKSTLKVTSPSAQDDPVKVAAEAELGTIANRPIADINS